MKKGRIISILLLSFVLGLLFINRDKLVSFANEDNINMLKVNTVVKNGTTFLFEEYVELDGYRDNCIIPVFYTEDGSKLTSDHICVYSNSSSKQVVIENDYADYWILVDAYFESMGARYEFYPYEYKAPEYQLECNPNKITMDTYATCTVTATTYYSIDNIEFDLALDDFIIYDEVKLEDVDELNKNEHHYVLSPKHIDYDYGVSADTSLLPFSKPIDIKLMEFKVKTEKEQEVAVLGNVKLNNIKYTDVSGNATYENLSSTVGQDKNEAKSEDEEQKPNPETVDMILIAVILFVISATVVLTISLRKKKVS